MEKKGQVWVETVIYTLIGLVVIGILLAAAQPKIAEMKDKAIIEQTISSLNEVNSKIYEVQFAEGNKRIVSLSVSKGNFYVDGANNQIGWIMDSNYKYSEPGVVLPLGNMKVVTQKGSPYSVRFFIEYNLNLTSVGLDSVSNLSSSPTPYRLSIENKGKNSAGLSNIDLSAS